MFYSNMTAFLFNPKWEENRLSHNWFSNKNTILYSAKTSQSKCYCDKKTEFNNNPLFWNQTQQHSYFISKQDQIIDYPWIKLCNQIVIGMRRLSWIVGCCVMPSYNKQINRLWSIKVLNKIIFTIAQKLKIGIDLRLLRFYINAFCAIF